VDRGRGNSDQRFAGSKEQSPSFETSLSKRPEQDKHMSVLGGIFNFGNDPAPIDGSMLAALGKALEARGPDGGGEAISARVGMTYRAFHTTNESQFESQPLTSSEGHMLTWDGRLDNRDDLIAELFSGPRTRIVTDAEIVLAAYLRWGQDSFVKLVGDFCLALFDPHQRLLLLVRDVLGTRPINYYLGRLGIVWSTELIALLEVANIPREVDEEYVAGFLIRYPKPGVTPYKNVSALKPNQIVSINQSGQLKETSYWRLDPVREIRYRCDEEYEEHFIHEFSAGIKAHLRSHRPVFSEASGGLDSSSIVCVGDRFVKSREAQAPRLDTISYVFDESPTADESRFIHCLEEHIGRSGHHLKESEYPFLANLDRLPSLVPDGVSVFAEYYRGAQQTMDDEGARVLLSGEGGDQMLGSSDDPAPELCDLLVQLRLLTLHSRLGVWSGALKRSYLWLLWKRTIIPSLPYSLQSLCDEPANQVPSWFDAKFVARARLRERQLAHVPTNEFTLPSARDHYAGFVSAVTHISSGYRRQRFNAELRYPYMYRPLVEFLQAIPFEQLVRPGETRSLMRRSLRTVLPDLIAKRRSKGNPHEGICRAVIRELPRLRVLFKESRVSDYGYVDPVALFQALELASHGIRISIVALLKTISLEFWLRTLEQSRGSTKTAGAHSALADHSEVDAAEPVWAEATG
jgi:asparagine synthase (glutamine-hydrolysing)